MTEWCTTDPRKAETLGEAAQNPDGTWNGARALSWLSEAMNPGKGASQAEAEALWDATKARAKRAAKQG